MADTTSLTRKRKFENDSSHDDHDSMAPIDGNKVSLKLLIDKRAEKVLFAEVGKDFVDFLYHIFALPLSTIVSLLSNGEESMMDGCLAKLKSGIQNLSETHLLPYPKKVHGVLGFGTAKIFNPRANLLLLPCDDNNHDDAGDDTSKTLYMCSNEPKQERPHRNMGYYDSSVAIPFSFPCRPYTTEYRYATCPGCNGSMSVAMTPVVPEEKRKAMAAERVEKRVAEVAGYFKGVVTYMVTDDLVVKPMSAISCFTLLHNFKVKDLGDLDEKIVSFGKNEGLKLLKAAMRSDEVLTGVFLGGEDRFKNESTSTRN